MSMVGEVRDSSWVDGRGLRGPDESSVATSGVRAAVKVLDAGSQMVLVGTQRALRDGRVGRPASVAYDEASNRVALVGCASRAGARRRRLRPHRRRRPSCP